MARLVDGEGADVRQAIRISAAAWEKLRSHPKVLAQLRELGEVRVTDSGEILDPSETHIDIHNGTVTISTGCENSVLAVEYRFQPVKVERPTKKAQWKRDRGLGRFAR